MDQTDDICVLCCRNISIYAVGFCDHHVCYECSTRMRVLCKQNECPICRSDLPKVVFSQRKKTFNELSEVLYPVDKKYKIYFEDNYCRRAYEKLLEHSCKICNQRCSFHSFGHLKNHMRREHELFFCELCVENLRIFTSERRCYTREELGRHRRIGDKDDTSHRGHPLCKFCDQRYVDSDELFRHLRREHYFCHFCDADGLANKFYSDYEYLRNHFRQQHYLCEEGTCRDEKFTAAFRSEIDFKAHKAVQHSKNLSKAQAKQARTLELEFTIRPHSSQHNSSLSLHSEGRVRRHDRYEPQNKTYQPVNSRNETRTDSPDFGNESYTVKSKQSLDTCSEEQFPCLSLSASASGQNTSKINNKTMANCLNKDTNMKSSSSEWVVKKTIGPNDSDFPALRSSVHLPGGQSSASSSSELVVSSARHPINQPHKTVLFHFNSQNSKKNPTRHATNVSIKVAKPKKLNLSVEENHFNSKCNNNNSMQSLSRTESSKTEFYTGTTGYHNGAVNSVKRLVNKKINNDILLPSNSAEEKKTKQQELLIPVSKETSDRSNGEQTQPYITVKCKSKKKKSKTISLLLENELKQSEMNGEHENKKENSVTSEYNHLCENGNTEELYDSLKISKLNQNSENSDSDECLKQTKNLAISDFPELPSQMEKKISAPPGFVTNIVPPPGFKTENSVQTNSVPNINISSSYHNYIEPPDFQYRNIVLIQEIQKLLRSNETLFMEFKALSGQFRQCQISAKEYHEKCLEMLGKDNFMKVISELLVLLPDIKKQQELLKVHTSFCRKQAENSGAVPKNSTWSEAEKDFDFVVCDFCKQVLWNKDFQSHQARHTNSDYLNEDEVVKNSN
ncbi:E3 ubiquitin-protein ligase ZNF598-like isoform X2 [Centruroides sculpturatus]|uniref:E3 ubiquitin-protein ligase ZNF598-like isoform X1 n=1 Tax=Centruroides sculpturatus TaxID=218467 RepID=UPI000C6DB30D|nr:E3 ubiquitin-protein ligase ZNF598-like isoform X1 [Centruroides sculpturatus]XP_023226308.1 E3 ubiquitin-protein ligase ZNF598-like isoform X2 [Centruroides sculpturatus]